MGVHHPASGGDALVEHPLHHVPLIERRLEANGIALPVGARPRRLRCRDDAGNASQQLAVRRRQRAAPLDDRGQTRELFTADRRLNVGHPVVEGLHRIFLEHDLGRSVTDGIWHGHAVLPQEAERRIQRRAARRQHATVARGQQLARVEREAGDVAVRPAHTLPSPVPQQLAADRAGRILDHRHAAALCDRQDRRELAWHAELVDDEDRPGPLRHRRFDERGIDVERVRGDIDEHRRRTAAADGVRRRDERMTDGDHLVAGPDAEGQQSEVQCGRAARHRARVRRADGRGELALEGGDLRTLGDPSRQDHAASRFGVPLVEPGSSNRDGGRRPGHTGWEAGIQLRTISCSRSSSGVLR